ncbi:hypothetical protein RvY_09317 [Ramazzottius varieornatus]|uniref:Major facilitator superfamily (MFS) profile domain-containing protein n=1 Tax=Ramazzottius varieornatus TaxID=947166 RepID=A0A1D1V8Z4_RAMVA|nr:hypothetical protein RvY_09317 [Ramazzottius varieornatus]
MKRFCFKLSKVFTQLYCALRIRARRFTRQASSNNNGEADMEEGGIGQRAQSHDPLPVETTTFHSSSTMKQTSRLPLLRKACYGVGHVLNDLCAAMWFSYLLVFLHQVLNFSSTFAGAVILLGQVADAVATPFVGYESDQSRSGFFGYGRRKSWHLIGTFCVVATFPFLFIDCISCHDSHDWAKFIYFAPFVLIFQFGWASVQIASLAMIPDLTSDDSERVELNSIRYAWTIASNLLVFVLTAFVLRYGNKDSERVTPNDAGTFQLIVFVVVGIGVVFSVIFHLGVKEQPFTHQHSVGLSDEMTLPGRRHMTWKSWFIEPHFYIVSCLYMSTRLFVNLTQVYMPMYILDTLRMSKESIGYVPFVVYFVGFLCSIIMKPATRRIGKKVTCVLGIMAGLAVTGWIQFLNVDDKNIYGIAALLGASGTILTISSQSITNDLIAGNTETGAFVFGVMSFADKLANGAAVMAVQLLQPATTDHMAHSDFFGKVMVYVPTGACLIALVSIVALVNQTVGLRNRRTDWTEALIPAS